MFWRTFKVPGSNLACAPSIVPFFLCFTTSRLSEFIRPGDDSYYNKEARSFLLRTCLRARFRFRATITCNASKGYRIQRRDGHSSNEWIGSAADKQLRNITSVLFTYTSAFLLPVRETRKHTSSWKRRGFLMEQCLLHYTHLIHSKYTNAQHNPKNRYRVVYCSQHFW